MRASLQVALVIAMLAGVPSARPRRVVAAEWNGGADVRTLLHARCVPCHGALEREGGLRLDTAAAARAGGDSGPAVVPGDADASLLLRRVSAAAAEERMPPEGAPLSGEEIELLRRWIAAGAEGPAGEVADEDPRRHWAFVRPVRPPLPGGPGDVHPIDALLAPARREAGTVPRDAADRATLLRRVTLDLIGIPPTADEIRAFLADDAPDAYERVVDRLLASPLHAERMARHWMDVWRYSDWYGRRSVPDVMNSYPMIWRWRDWIVRSIEADVPYDRMVVEMLAADELCPDDLERVVATGYLVRSWFKWNYETWKKDLVEHVGKAFLGLSLNCAQCHDHKYDPVSQEDYFRFRAFFEPLELRHDRVPGEKDPGPFEKYVYAKSYGPISTGLVRVCDEGLDAETFVFAKGDARLRLEGRPPVAPGVPAILPGLPEPPQRRALPVTAAYPGLRPFVIDEERAARRDALDAARAAPPLPCPSADEIASAIAAARRAVAGARATAAPGPEALEGRQSLLLDAAAGRRALSHRLPDIAEVGDGGSVSWLVEIRDDGHTNLQLGLDIARGATGAFVAFEEGSIKSYAPGGFVETVVGRYDPAAGRSRFEVSLRLDLARDGALLSVRSLADGSVPVDSLPVAINGWRPADDGKRGLFVDCRPGTVAAYDAILFRAADGREVAAFRFEEPIHRDATEVVEAGGWSATPFCQAPATSLVLSAEASDPALRGALGALSRAEEAARLGPLDEAARGAAIEAAERELASFESRVAADMARYSHGTLAADRKGEPEVAALVAAAANAERAAAESRALAAVAGAERDVARAAGGLVSRGAAASPQAATAGDDAAKAFDGARRSLETATAALAAERARSAEPAAEYAPLSPKYVGETTGRRTALARWIASPDNPLTARVAVNHLWGWHFGEPLVATTADFGRNGVRPTQPALLDWLACEFVDSGWSMKHLHRLIVTSAAYRMASGVPATPEGRRSAAVDRENRTLWRFPATRMEAEVVRDSLLAVAGELDTTRGGPEIEQAQGLSSRRRSLWFSHHGEEKMEFLDLFDAPNPGDCYRRTTSVQPQQALALVNSDLTRSLAAALAARLSGRAGSGADAEARFVEEAFVTVLGRPATEDERAASVEFLVSQAATLAAEGAAEPVVRARAGMVHALMNHNDFVTVR